MIRCKSVFRQLQIMKGLVKYPSIKFDTNYNNESECGSDKLFLYSKHGSIDRMAESPNKLRIKQNSQEVDGIPGRPNPQTKHKNMTNYVWDVLGIFMVITVPLSVQAGFFDDLFTGKYFIQEQSAVVIMNSATEVPLLSALQNPDPLGARGGAELIIDNGALVSSGPIGEDEIAVENTYGNEISVYTVREGDDISRIAAMFDVSPNTIRWANDCSLLFFYK